MISLMFLLSILGICGEVVILDISSPVNPNKIVEIRYNGDGFVQSLYLPYLKVTIGKVVDGNEIIWEPTRKGEICHRFKVNRQYGIPILAYADLSRNRQTKFIHYQFFNGSWNTIDEQLYLRLYMKMQTERKFDLSDPTKGDMCHIQDYCPFGAPSLIYTPQTKYHVRSIVDRDKVLWSSNDAKCEYVVTHGDANNPRFFHCFIKTTADYETLYYEKINDAWIQIPRDEFFARLDLFDRESDALAKGQGENCEPPTTGGMADANYKVQGESASYKVEGAEGSDNHVVEGEMPGASYAGGMEDSGIGVGELPPLDESYSDILTNISSECPDISFSSDDPQGEFFDGVIDAPTP